MESKTEERSEREMRFISREKMASIMVGCMGLPIVFCAPIILFGDYFLNEGAVNVIIAFSSLFILIFMMGLMILGLKMSRSKEEFWSDADIPLQVLIPAKLVFIGAFVSIFLSAGAINYLFRAQVIDSSFWRVSIMLTFALVSVIFIDHYLKKKYRGMRVKYFFSVQTSDMDMNVKETLDSLNLRYNRDVQGSKKTFEKIVYQTASFIEIEIYSGRGTIVSIRPVSPEGIATAKAIEKSIDAAVVQAPAVSI